MLSLLMIHNKPKEKVIFFFLRHIRSKPIKTHSTPSRRDRYFWGNLPHMHERDWTDIPEVTLQSCLDSHRKANVTILPTQTTSSHSQFKGIPYFHYYQNKFQFCYQVLAKDGKVNILQDMQLQSLKMVGLLRFTAMNSSKFLVTLPILLMQLI